MRRRVVSFATSLVLVVTTRAMISLGMLIDDSSSLRSLSFLKFSPHIMLLWLCGGREKEEEEEMLYGAEGKNGNLKPHLPIPTEFFLSLLLE